MRGIILQKLLVLKVLNQNVSIAPMNILLTIPGGSQGDVAVVLWKFDQEECRKALCRMGIIDEFPFNFVEKEGFRAHKGEDMANDIGRCLREWRINKIFTITVDNASSNYVTVKELSKHLTKMGANLMNGDHLHVRCMTYIMNLVVQDSLKESSVWNSTYLMLSRVVEFENAFTNYASREIGLRHYLENSYIEVGENVGELLSGAESFDCK
ncbi:hypothetical protein P3S68_007520 [Capsicum galapagoense]